MDPSRLDARAQEHVVNMNDTKEETLSCVHAVIFIYTEDQLKPAFMSETFQTSGDFVPEAQTFTK